MSKSKSNQLTSQVTTTAGNEILAFKEQLKDPQSPDIAFILSSVPEFKKSATCLDESDRAKIANPAQLSLQEEWLALDKCLWYRSYSVVF